MLCGGYVFRLLRCDPYWPDHGDGPGDFGSDQQHRAVPWYGGALSIVRFRTAIKEPSDIVFLFWSIAAGIVLAAGLIPLAIFGSLLIGLILLIFSRQKSYDSPYILVIHCTDADAERASREMVQRQVKKLSLKSKSVTKGCIELNYEVRLKDANTDFINELADLPGVSHTVMVSYNGDYMN